MFIKSLSALLLATCLTLAGIGAGWAQPSATASLATLRPLAEQGDAEAQYTLGRLYYYDEPGVPRDYHLSFRWFRLAALQGHAAAQYKLGGMFFSGRGVAPDDTQAIVWWRRAAVQHQPESLNILGALHANGRGVPRDIVLAYALQTLAHEYGDTDAAANLNAKQVLMSAAEIAAAATLATELRLPGELARRLSGNDE